MLCQCKKNLLFYHIRNQYKNEFLGDYDKIQPTYHTRQLIIK